MLVDRYRKRLLSAEAHQQLLRDGRWTMDTINKIARNNADYDDRMERVNSIADRYARNVTKYLKKKGIDATQWWDAWSPSQQTGVPREAYMGLNKG